MSRCLVIFFDISRKIKRHIKLLYIYIYIYENLLVLIKWHVEVSVFLVESMIQMNYGYISHSEVLSNKSFYRKFCKIYKKTLKPEGAFGKILLCKGFLENLAKFSRAGFL